MFAPNVIFEGFSTEDWRRFLSLFEPRKEGGAERDPDRPQGTILFAYDERGPLKALSTKQGRLPLSLFTDGWPYQAAEVARRANASLAICFRRGATERIMDRFALGIRRGDDLTAQSLVLVNAVRAEGEAGNFEIWPPRMTGMPVPTAAMVRASLDAICPPGKSTLLAVFEHEQLWTAIGLRRSSTGIDAIVGPRGIQKELGLLAGDWRRDYRHVGRCTEDLLGELSFACYTEVATLRNLEVDPSPGAWARAVVVRDVILSPVPAALGLPLGLDVGRAAVSTLREVAERFDPLGLMGPTLDVFRTMFSQGHGSDSDGATGFSPLELLRKLLVRER